MGAVWGILLQQQLQPPLHLAAWCSRKNVGGIKPKTEALGRVCTLEVPWAHIRGTRETAHLGGPETTSHAPGRVSTTEGPEWAPIAPRRVHAWTCGTGGWLLESWAGGWLSAGQEWRRAKLSPLSLLQPKRPAKPAWPVWKQETFFVVFFSSNSLLFFSFKTFFLSFLLSCSIPSFFPFISLLPSFFFFSFSFFNSYKWDSKTWNCKKTRVGPKEGASQQLRQWNKFHFATPENLQVIAYLHYYFFILHHSFY